MSLETTASRKGGVSAAAIVARPHSCCGPRNLVGKRVEGLIHAFTRGQ